MSGAVVGYNPLPEPQAWMLTTRDEKLDAKFRLLRQHAMSVPDTVRHSSTSVIFEEYPVVGHAGGSIKG